MLRSITYQIQCLSAAGPDVRVKSSFLLLKVPSQTLYNRHDLLESFEWGFQRSCMYRKKKTQTAVTGMTQMYVISYCLELDSFKEWWGIMTLGGPSDVLRFNYHSIQTCTCSIVALCEGPDKKWPEMAVRWIKLDGPAPLLPCCF